MNRKTVLSFLCAFLMIGRTTNTVVKAAVVPMNERVLVDMVQLNPGDDMGRQQSQYNSPAVLEKLGYTARTTTTEVSPLLTLTFTSCDRCGGKSIWDGDPTAEAWRTSYVTALKQWGSTNSTLETMYFTDMIVFPIKLLELYPEVFQNGTIMYNSVTEYLITIMMDEWMTMWPETGGLMIRTGETYVFDTPYHAGSSPCHEGVDCNSVWIQFIRLMRKLVCVKYHRKLLWRTWDSIRGLDSYTNITSQIKPHGYLYFLIKHTEGDFLHQMAFNPMLGHGAHAQIIEVQCQREYEGKGAFPSYVQKSVIEGGPFTGSKGIQSLFGNTSTSIIRGIWTWSRGGGWWGPYIKGNEFWIDLNVAVISRFWQHDGGMSEEDVFFEICHERNLEEWKGIDCMVLRSIALKAESALLYGRYCPEMGGIYWGCIEWFRDDRLGGLNQLSYHFENLHNFSIYDAALQNRKKAIDLWQEIFSMVENTLFSDSSVPLYTQIRNSVSFAIHLFTIIEAAYRVMVYGSMDVIQVGPLTQAIFDYDASWMSWRAEALIQEGYPSIFHGYYFNLPNESPELGLDHTVDSFRNLTFDLASSRATD